MKTLEEEFRNHNHCHEHTGVANAHGKCNIHKWIRFQAFPSLFHVLFLSNLTNTTYFWPLFNFPLPKQRSLLIRMRPQITARRTVSHLTVSCSLSQAAPTKTRPLRNPIHSFPAKSVSNKLRFTLRIYIQTKDAFIISTLAIPHFHRQELESESLTWDRKSKTYRVLDPALQDCTGLYISTQSVL